MGLLVPAHSTAYGHRVRPYAEIDDQSCFARWLLEPMSGHVEPV
jgi:hypothetical protein